MSNPRITLKGVTLDACNRILSQTPIENYTELFKLLLMRYEQEFIAATNGYLRQGSAPVQPDVVSKLPLEATRAPSNAKSLPDKESEAPSRTGQSMLTDF